MENQSRMKKQESKKKEISENRSPLQDLNGKVLINRKNFRKNCSNSSSVSVEAPKERSLLSSSSSSSTSCSSSTKTLLTKKSKPQFRFTNCTTQKSAAAGRGRSSLVLRSKENDIRKKSVSQMLRNRKNHIPLFYQRKINTKSTLSSGPRNPVNTSKKGLEKFGAKIKNLQENGPGESTIEPFGISDNSNSLNSVEKCTPAGKIACGSGLEFINLYDNKSKRENSTSRTIDSNCSTATKTPPVEASVSPEIQCESHSKVLVSTAFMTPICYGAGHLISGVTDKRKCRSRGILTVGRENANLFEYKSDEGKAINESRASLIPMPAGASLQWLLSPCDEEHEGNDVDLKKELEHCMMISGNDSVLLDLGSSPSTLSGNASDFVCDSDSYFVSSDVGDTASTGKTRNVLLSPRRAPELRGFTGPSSREIDEFFLVDTPHCTPNGKAISSREDENYSYNQMGDSAAASVGSLSSGNVIQTPDSNSSSGHIDDYEHQRRHFESEFDSVTEILQGVSISPRSKMSICDTPGLDMHCSYLASDSHSIDLNQLPQKNLDKTSSVFESMSENLSLSQMRISWRDGLVSQTYEMDEFDCCRCLSDEEADAEGCANKHLMAFPGTESSANKECDDLRNDDLKSPVLECESNISEKRKATLSPDGRNSCAESICTNGGDLVASGDSDWTICYKNHFI